MYLNKREKKKWKKTVSTNWVDYNKKIKKNRPTIIWSSSIFVSKLNSNQHSSDKESQCQYEDGSLSNTLSGQFLFLSWLQLDVVWSK